MNPTQRLIINAMRKAQESNGCILGNITMFRPFGHYERIPTWVCDYPHGKQVIYSINKAGYNVYQRRI